MKPLKLLRKTKIIFLYHYFLIEENKNDFTEFINFYSEKDNEDVKNEKLEWFKNFIIQKNEILEEIKDNLNDNWEISRIPVLEKSVLTLSIYEMKNLKEKNEKTIFFIINKTVEISKKYFEFEKHKYINKILDNVGKKIIKKQIFKR